MPDLQRIDRELDAARERDDHHAQVRLITVALALPESEPDRAGYLDELAYAYEKLGRFDEAIDAMRQAVAAGWDGELDDHPSAQALIADLLLRAGRHQEADEAWLQAEREDPRNPWVHTAASDAYTRVGLHRKALPWQTKGLELALAAGEEEGELADLLTDKRDATLDVLGLEPDELQLRAAKRVECQEQQDREYEQEFLRRWNQPPTITPRQAYIGVAWFPLDQYQRALHLAELRRGLRARTLPRLLRPTRDTPARPQIPRRQTTRALTNHHRRVPRPVRRAPPRPRRPRHPGELQHRATGTEDRQSMATRAQ